VIARVRALAVGIAKAYAAQQSEVDDVDPEAKLNKRAKLAKKETVSA